MVSVKRTKNTDAKSVDVKNISQFGAVYVPAIRADDIEAEEVVLVPVEIANVLDPDHFERIDGKPVGTALYPAIVPEPVEEHS